MWIYALSVALACGTYVENVSVPNNAPACLEIDTNGYEVLIESLCDGPGTLGVETDTDCYARLDDESTPCRDIELLPGDVLSVSPHSDGGNTSELRVDWQDDEGGSEFSVKVRYTNYNSGCSVVPAGSAAMWLVGLLALGVRRR